MKTFVGVLMVGLLLGCTDTTRAKLWAYGDAASVRCFSGDSLIYAGHSTGKVANPSGSDGYQFMEEGTDQLVEVSGNCIIRYAEEGK